MQGLSRRNETNNSLAGQADVQPAQLTGVQIQSPRIPAAQDVDLQSQIANQFLKWGGGKLAEEARRRQDRDVLEGQMAYQQGATFEQIETAGNKWALEGYRLMDAQTTASSLLSAQRADIAQNGHTLSQDEFRQQIISRTDAMLEGKDPETARLVRAQMSEQLPTLVDDHTTQHVRWKEEQNYDSLVRSVEVVSRDPTATDTLVDFARGGEGSASEGLSDARRSAAVVDGVIRAMENDNPLAYDILAKEGLLGDNLSADQQNQIKAAQDRYSNRRRNEFNLERLNQERELTAAVDRGEISAVEATTRRAAILAEHEIKVTQADAGEIYTAATNSERVAGRTAATNFEEARLRGDYGVMAKIMEPVLIQIESGGNPDAVSPTGAKGLFQVLDSTNSDPGYGVRPAQNDSKAERVRVGQDYWKAMMGGKSAHQTLLWEPGDLEAAALAYNQGPGVANAWIKAGRNFDAANVSQEGRNYVAKMTRGLENWRAPTAQDKLQIAQQNLQETRERLNMDAYEQAYPRLQELDDSFLGGKMSREDWQSQRRGVFDELQIARDRGDMMYEVNTARAASENLSRVAKQQADTDYKVRLEAASGEVGMLQASMEAVLSNPDATLGQKREAIQQFKEERDKVLDGYGVTLVDRNEGSAAEAMYKRHLEAEQVERKVQQDRVEIDHATRFGYLSDLPKEQQNRAFRENAQRLQKDITDAVAEGSLDPDQAGAVMAQQQNAFFAEAGVVDPDVKRVLSAALRSPLIDKDGNPNPRVVDAIQQYAEVHAMNPHAAKTMLDEAGLNIASAALARAPNPTLIGEAVRDIALEAKDNPFRQDTDEFMARPETLRHIDRVVQDTLKTKDIGILRALTSGSASMDQVTDNSRQALETLRSEQTREIYTDLVSDEVARLQRITPHLRPEDLAARAAENVSMRVDIVGGSPVFLDVGKDIRQEFFGDKAGEFGQDGAINSAVMTWLRSDEARAQYPEIGKTSWTEWLFFDAQRAEDTWGTGVRPFTAFSAGNNILVSFQAEDGTNSDYIVVPMRRAGEMHMQQTRERLTK